jgi:glycogen debranching enzyme
MKNGKPTESKISKTPSRKRAAKAKPSEANSFYIQATSPLADEQSRVLKHGETFAVFDHFGDIKPAGLGEEGLYHEGTRFLSCLILRLGPDRPMFLSSTVKEDNDLLAVDVTNPDVYQADQMMIPRGTLHLARTKFLWQEVCYECLKINNYGLATVTASFSYHFEADFADIFEVRGTKRKRRGQYLDGQVDPGSVCLSYRGLDGVTRHTRLEFSPKPTTLSTSDATFMLELRPKAEAIFYLTIVCVSNQGTCQPTTYTNAFVQSSEILQNAKDEICDIYTMNDPFNCWINRSLTDLQMMTTETSAGPYPFAGVPWYSTVFGRDGIITALECLWLQPSLARGVLTYLAETQARAVIPEQDAEPGKILHETRKGEMAALGEVPFGRYYGSVDATPLFIMLAGAYFERTADRALIESIWPNLELALRWIDTYGDADGDGFVEYQRHTDKGLIHQGWKDSHDSIFHADGSLAQGPIALCEVQGYVYAAKRYAATLAAMLGNLELASELLRHAQVLQARFEKTFWCEDLCTYALALDGAKRACRVQTSNAGHCLLTGIAGAAHAPRIAQGLLEDHFFSGWGIRTVAASEVRYNPMSYHNGSVWPHDNALIAAGLDRFGFKQLTLEMLSGLFEASRFVDLHRLPELFCGFSQRKGEGPILYPVACSPQSWSAAAVFMLLQACLGLHINGPEETIRFVHPVLPEFLKEVRIRNLRVGGSAVDLLLQRHAHHVGINVLRKVGRVEVIVLL